MKKIISIVALFYCLIVIFVSPVNAFDFVKSNNNPLPITFTLDYTQSLQGHIYKEGNLYKGILAAKKANQENNSLVAIESLDGVNWQMTKEIIVSINKDISNPRLIVDKEGNKKIFFAQKDDIDLYRIYSVDCDNDLNCSQTFNLVLAPNVNDTTENHGFFAPYVLYLDDNYYLFYGAWGNNGFKIKMAYSNSLSNWQKCPNNLIGDGADGPFPYIENNYLYIFYHKSNSSGIKLKRTTFPFSCNSAFEDLNYQLVKTDSYDQKHIIYPSVIKDEEGLIIYYTGLGNNNSWRLNVATTGFVFPKPTPTPIVPVVILPGFMASWNKEAVLHNQTVDYSAWKLQNFVRDYDGLVNTFKNIGYQENINLFLFSYDWRQSVDKTKDDLNNFLQAKIWDSYPDQKVSLIGHSLGGLIARIFTQNYKEKVHQIITVGSPHQGVVQVYKPLEAGEIDRDNTFLWLAEKIILILNKSTIESDRATIANKFPVAKDLFPIFNFLKDLSGNEISIKNMSMKNDLLSLYKDSFPDIFPLFTAVYGEKDSRTPAGFIVQSADSFNLLLGNYLDGQPKSSLSDVGDYTVLSKSANQDADAEKLNFDHGEIITKKDAIKKILGLLNINFNDEQIIEGQATKISSSLIFLIKSPARMTVEFNNSTYLEDEGIIFIPDTQSGSYNLKVQGTNQGKYEVIVGQISENNDLWEKIDGEITKSPAESQTDEYAINYDSQNAVSIFPTPTLAAEVLTEEVLIPTATPTATPTPTAVPQSTNSSSSSSSSSNNQSTQGTNNETLLSKESSPTILGASTISEELVTPTLKTIKPKIENPISKKSSVWDFILPPIITGALGGAGWLFRKKLLKKIFYD